MTEISLSKMVGLRKTRDSLVSKVRDLSWSQELDSLHGK